MTKQLTLDDLPSPSIVRWNAFRKGAVAKAIVERRLSIEDAAELYDVSIEELRLWLRRFTEFGYRALRATRTQDYRGTRP